MFTIIMKYTIETIDGLPCLFAPMQDAHSVTIQVLVKAGSIYEDRTTNGLSHFLEHMFFKGGKTYKTPAAVAEAVDAFGGEFNAFTGNEYAGYYVKCAPGHVRKAIDVLADMMCHARFPREELEREKGVVIQELKMYEDSPRSLVAKKRHTWFYGDNHYGWPIIGTEKNVLSFDQDALFAHKQRLYTKDNMLVVIAGAFESDCAAKTMTGHATQEELSSWLAAGFGDLPPHKGEEALEPFVWQLPDEQEASFAKDTEQHHLIISAPGFDGHDETYYAANILSTILGGNMSSRLFQRIREKLGLCYYIGGYHSAATYVGGFIFRAGMAKDQFSFGLERIYNEFVSIASGDITEYEFANAIGYKTGNLQMGIESSDDLADFLGAQWLLYGKIETLEDILAKYQGLTIHDVQAVCEKLLKENLYLYSIG